MNRTDRKLAKLYNMAYNRPLAELRMPDYDALINLIDYAKDRIFYKIDAKQGNEILDSLIVDLC